MTQDETWLLKEKYNGEKTEGFFTDVEKLKSGEPLAYIIGYIPFLNTTIFLDSKPLIPRTETEYWVEREIQEIQNRRNLTPTITVLDLCAGSGCIGTALLKTIPGIEVDFAEIDEKHHSTIKKNLTKNGIDTSRTKIYGGDLFENIKVKYDYIFSNPPYIDPILDRVQTSVKNFEPKNALYGGNDGLEIIDRIITEAPQHLTHQGVLVIEHEPEQGHHITQVAASHGFASIETLQDQFGVERYSRLKISL